MRLILLSTVAVTLVGCTPIPSHTRYQVLPITAEHSKAVMVDTQTGRSWVLVEGPLRDYWDPVAFNPSEKDLLYLPPPARHGR